MRNNVFFSIIIPAYNCKKYLHECIDSVLKQEYENFEIILVDDGSTDCSGVICDEYARIDQRVRVFHKKNGGVSSARNFGLKKSRGVYCIFLDSDDYWADGVLNEATRILEGHRYPDILMGWSKTFLDDNQGKLIDSPLYNYYSINGKNGIEVLEYLMKVNSMIYSVWRYFIKRDIIEKNDIYFEEKIKIGEDVEYLPRLFYGANSFAYMEKPFYFYRAKRSDSLSNIKRDYDDDLTDRENILSSIISLAMNCENNYRSCLLGYAAIVYISFLSAVAGIKKGYKEEYLLQMEKYKYVLSSKFNIKICIIYYLVKYLGINTTSFLLLLRINIIKMLNSK